MKIFIAILLANCFNSKVRLEEFGPYCIPKVYYMNVEIYDGTRGGRCFSEDSNFYFVDYPPLLTFDSSSKLKNHIISFKTNGEETLCEYKFYINNQELDKGRDYSVYELFVINDKASSLNVKFGSKSDNQVVLSIVFPLLPHEEN